MNNRVSQGPAATNENGLHFLPVMTTRPMSRRDVELLRSSARSHLAKTGHREKRLKKGKGHEEGTGNGLQQLNALDSQTPASDGVSNLALAHQKIDLHPGLSDKSVDQHTKMLLNYCMSTFWPGFGLGSATFHIPTFALCFEGLVAQGPALFHAVLWQASVNLNFNRKSNITDVGSINHYQGALKHISQDTMKPAAEIPEATLYAILSLVAPEIPFENQQDSLGICFNPPLAELAWIHAFGRRPLTGIHSNALFHMVDLKGGVDCLSFPGFSADINYMDLIRSTQNLTKPHFPISKVYSSIQTEHSRKRFFGHFFDFQDDIGQNHFLVGIDKLSKLGLSEDLLEVMQDMHVWVKILERYHVGALSNPDLSIMSSHRDLIQHRLLSTLSGDGFEGLVPPIGGTADSPISVRNLVQTALLIFSLGVTFPVRYPLPFNIAGGRLKDHIEHDLYELLRLELYDFLLWLGILGALCAKQVGNGALKTWYIGLLYTVERAGRTAGGPVEASPTVRTWHEVKESVLLHFLWCGIACDVAAEVVWSEVEWQMRRLDAP